MRLTRLEDGTLLVETRWDEFRTEYKRAPLGQRLVLDDGRPAARSSPGTLMAPHPVAWQLVRHWLKTRHPDAPAPKRVRLCEACGSEMTVVRELAWTWCFRCPKCSSLEVHGKDVIGGQIGAGEKERS